MINMKDGKQLTADIYRLEGAVPKPVLVVLKPYDKDQIVIPGDIFDFFCKILLYGTPIPPGPA